MCPAKNFLLLQTAAFPDPVAVSPLVANANAMHLCASRSDGKSGMEQAGEFQVKSDVHRSFRRPLPYLLSFILEGDTVPVDQHKQPPTQRDARWRYLKGLDVR